MKSFLLPTKKKIIESLSVSLILWGIRQIQNYLFPPLSTLFRPAYFLRESDSERFQRVLSENITSFIVLSVVFLILYLLVSYIGTKVKKSSVIVIIVVLLILFVVYVLPFTTRLIWLNYYNFSPFPNR